MTAATPPADAVLDFWFAGPEGAPARTPRAEWFRKDAAFDATIAARFGGLIDDALAGRLDGWAAAPRSALARLLLLDQFTRNTRRDSAAAFAGDPQALAQAEAMVAAGTDRTLAPIERVFVYLPYEHAENLARQDDALRLFAALGAEAPELADYGIWAAKHRAVIARFGRFPHRNALLGRTSTAEEEAFLEAPGSRF